MISISGTVPGPITFGAAFDGACSLWQANCDGSNGQCLFYDLDKLSLNIFLISFVIKTASFFCILLAWRLYRPPKFSAAIQEELPKQEVVMSPEITPEQKQNGGIVSPVFEPDISLNINTSNSLKPNGNLEPNNVNTVTQRFSTDSGINYDLEDIDEVLENTYI